MLADRIDAVMAVAASLALLGMCLQFILQPPRIEGQYLDVPTETRMPGGWFLDEGAYFLRDKYLGLALGAAETPDSERLARFPKVNVTMTPKLQAVIDDCHQDIDDALVFCIQHGADEAERTQDDGPHRIHLENLVYADGCLVATDVITASQLARLEAAAAESERDRMADLATQSRRFDEDMRDHAYTPDELAFLRANVHELTSQVMSRRILHHQNFMLGPIQELEHGRPSEEINAQYGYFTACALQKALHYSGGVSYGSYYALVYAIIPLYTLSSAWLYWRICGSSVYATSLLCVSVAAFGISGYEVMAMAPGMNPMRHLLDMAAIALAISNLQRHRPSLMLACYLCCFLSILLNAQSGISLLCSVAGASAIRSICERSGIARVPIREILLAAIGLAIAVGFRLGKDELSHYYFDGLVGYPTHTWVVVMFLLLMGCVILLLVSCWKTLPPHEKYGLIMLSIYSQLMFCYYIWGGTKYHLLNYCAIYWLNALFLLQVSSSQLSWPARWDRVIVVALRAVSSALLAISLLIFGVQEKEYLSIFSSHRAYRWDLPRARILSTMPEQPFADAASLVDRYAPHPGIAILSEYDNFLPFLADRFSEMPYPDLQWFLVSDRERDRVVSQLRHHPPKFLFTDRNLMRELACEVINPHIPIIGTLNAESIVRVRRLRVLQDIFLAVSSHYTLVESAGLLSVWKLRSSSGEGR